MSISEITPQDFGALGDNLHDDTAAVQNAIAYALPNGRNLFFPVGTYLLSGPITFDLSLLADPITHASSNYGITVYGEGQRSVLNFVTSTPYAGALFSVMDTQSAGTFIDFHLKDLKIQGSTLYSSTAVYPLVQLGRQDYADILLDCQITNLTVLNNAIQGSLVGPAVFLGSVYTSRVEGYFVSADTVGLWVGGAQHSRFLVHGNTQGNAGQKAAIYLTNSVNPSFSSVLCNLFLNPNAGGNQASTTGILIDGANCLNNLFVAPFFNSLATGISATAGSGNRVIQPYYNSNVTTPVGSTTGLTIN